MDRKKHIYPGGDQNIEIGHPSRKRKKMKKVGNACNINISKKREDWRPEPLPKKITEQNET